MKPYFSHDEGARNDPKLVKVLMRLGQAGKGVYWDLVEMLYEQGGYLPLAEVESYAYALRTDVDLITKLINDFGLFVSDEVNFWSETALERFKMRNEKAERRAAAGAKGGKVRAEREAIAKAALEQPLSDTQAMLEQSLSTAQASKVKEIKGNKRTSDDVAGSQPAEDLATPLPANSDAGAVGGATRLVPADEADVFMLAGFREYVKSIGFGTIDIGFYIVQILHEAKKEAKPRPNSGKGLTWEGFVKNYLTNDRLHNRLVLPLPADGQPTGPHQQQKRLAGNPSSSIAAGNLTERIHAQQSQEFIL